MSYKYYIDTSYTTDTFIRVMLYSDVRCVSSSVTNVVDIDELLDALTLLILHRPYNINNYVLNDNIYYTGVYLYTSHTRQFIGLLNLISALVGKDVVYNTVPVRTQWYSSKTLNKYLNGCMNTEKSVLCESVV